MAKQNIQSFYIPTEHLGTYTEFLNILELLNSDKRHKHQSKSELIIELIKNFVETYKKEHGSLVLKEEPVQDTETHAK